MSTQTRGPTRVRSRLAILMAGALVGAAADSVYAVQYTFTPVAELGGTYTGIGLGLGSINNDGTVAYVGTSADGIQRVLKTSMDGTTTVIADTSGSLRSFYLASSFGTTPAINDIGLVGFVASTDQGKTGIYTGDGGTPLRLVAEGTVATIGYRPYLNASDQVMFHRQFSGGNGGEVVLDADGSQLILASTSTEYPHVAGLGLNSHGDVLVAKNSSNGVKSLLVRNGMAEVEFAVTGGAFSDIDLGDASLSDYHAVFLAKLSSGGQAVYSYRDGSLTRLLDTSGPFGFFYGVATNNIGEVLFMGGGGIFSTKDLTSPIVSLGDPLFGSSISHLEMFPNLNDLGQLAFRAHLADNRVLLVRADVVPEPGGLLLAVLGCIALPCRRRH